jgi:hypothetical protein
LPSAVSLGVTVPKLSQKVDYPSNIIVIEP